MNTELGKIQEAMSRKESNNKKGFAAQWHKFKVFLGIAETTPLQIKSVEISHKRRLSFFVLSGNTFC